MILTVFSGPPIWRQIQKQNFTDWKKLAAFLELQEIQQESILKSSHFPLNLPLRLAQKISKGTLDDPLLRQFLPTIDETKHLPNFVADPVGDNLSRRESKLLHKYEGRVLLVCTSACAMHCRYCFRQNFDYDTETKLFDKEISIIEEDSSIHEVILSGGDPLSLGNDVLNTLLKRISAIPHITRIRFHTRFPIGIPERIDADFVEMLSSIPQQIWFVIHCNHASELDNEILARLKLLQKKGMLILNQAVLLKGVNDDAETLKVLCETLVNHGIIPYYLHQLDRVQGASHFEVQEEVGHQLIADISKVLPGYAIPKYVREISGSPNKTMLIPNC